MKRADDLGLVKARGMEIATERYGLNFARRGGEFWACCPAHRGKDDTSFKWNPEYKRFNCFGACDTGAQGEDIIALIGRIEGRSFKDVANELSGGSSSNGHREADAGSENTGEGPGKGYDEPETPTTGAPARLEVPDRAVPYCDAEGLVVGGSVRTDNDDGTKSFRQFRHDGNGAWEWKAPIMPPPLDLPEILSRPEATVLVVEGEKAAVAASKLFSALVVTTSLGGSSAPTKTNWEALRGRDVVVWPDADEPGWAYAAKVSALLLAAGVAARVVDVPTSWPKGWDLADETSEDVGAMLRGAAALAADAVNPWEASIAAAWPEPEELPGEPVFPSLHDDVDGRARIHGVMPPDLARYLQATAAHQELAIESVLVSALPTLALAIGPNVLARGSDSHTETLSTWEMAVMPPGSRKSAGFAACQEALSELVSKVEKEGRERRALWVAREGCREQEEATLKKRINAYFASKHGEARGGSKAPTLFDKEEYQRRLAEIAVERLNDSDPGRVELYSSNATPEAVVERTAAAGAFAMLSADGASVIEGVAEYRGGDDGAPVSQWCKLHSGDAVRSTRAGRETLDIPAKSATLSVGVTIQADVLDKATENRAMRSRGFLARFSKYFPARVVPSGKEPPGKDAAASQWWLDTVRAIGNARPAAPTEVACSSDARTILRSFSVEMGRRFANPDDLGDTPALAEFAAKAHGQALRKAALFHAVQGKPYSDPINCQTLAWGIALTRMGLETEIALAGRGRGGTPFRLARFGELLRKSRLAEVTARVAVKKGWASDTGTARFMLEHLADAGWCRVGERKKPNGGRPSTFYAVNPRIHSEKPEYPPGETGETGDGGSSAGFAGWVPEVSQEKKSEGVGPGKRYPPSNPVRP